MFYCLKNHNTATISDNDSLYRIQVINVFKLGPLFIVFGILWFIYLYGLQTSQAWVFLFGIVLSLSTLWYLPFGTIISIISISILFLNKSKLGL